MATIAPMAYVLGDSPVRPLTADEVMRMVEAGILSEDERVELLHGLLWKKAVKSPAHEEVKRRLVRWIDPAAQDHHVRVEGPVQVADPTSLPEPDIAVVEPGDYYDFHPSAALLVIEVAASSLTTDMEIKAPLYAGAAVAEYWVVDVNARCVHVFTEPGPSGYAQRTTRSGEDRLAPTTIDVSALTVAALFAPR